MSKRRPITKKTRFEVFKRDSFTCQYCGKKAPDVLLVIDHIQPVAAGGTNDFLNLATSCGDCNSGKGDRRLTDTAVLDIRRQQLEDLQQRKEQIEMMFQWQQGLLDLDDSVISQLSTFWSKLVPGFKLIEDGIKGLKRLRRKFELDEITMAMRIAAEQYLKYTDGAPTKESVEVAWGKVGGICTIRRREQTEPNEQRLYYIRGVLRNKLRYLDEGLALQLLHDALAANVSLESLERHAKSVRNWTDWRNEIENFIARQDRGERDAEAKRDDPASV